MGYLSGELEFADALKNIDRMPKQKEFVTALVSEESPYFAAAYIGGQGSAKSSGLCIAAMINCLQEPNGLSLIGRLNMPALETTTMLTFLEMVPADWGTWQEAKKIWTFSNGHNVLFRHLDITDPKVSGHIRSLNLSHGYVDESSEVSEEVYFLLIGRLRRKTAKFHRLGLASNPAGHDWNWRHFFDPQRKPIMKQKNFGIGATSMENVFLPADYIENMRNTYPPDWFDRFVMGSFADFSDLVFKEFTEPSHVWDDTKHWEVFGGNRYPPDDWPIIIGMDIGGGEEGDPWAIPIIAVAPDGRLYQYAEVYGSGLRIKPIAEELRQLMGNHPLDGIAYDFAQRAAAMELEEYGIGGQPAIKEVRPGLFKTEQYIHIDPRLIHPFHPGINGSPRFFVSAACKHTIREMAAYKWAKDRSGNPKFEPAHENSHCFAAGTLIETDQGRKPIEEIQVGEMVWTRKGLRRVYWSGKTGEREVIRKFGLTVTPDHLIMAKSNGWTPICQTDHPETLSENKLWMDSALENIAERITTSVVSTASVGDFISIFGNDKMGRSRSAITFTIKTVIERIIQETIWKHSQEGRISNFTEEILPYALLRSLLNVLEHGTEAKKEKHGMLHGQRKLAGSLGRKLSYEGSRAWRAVTNFINEPSPVAVGNSALMLANHGGAELRGLIGVSSFACSAVSRFYEHDLRNQNFAPRDVRAVFNISVEGDQEFYAGGVLVHNSPSAIRYCIHTFRPEPSKIEAPKIWNQPGVPIQSKIYWQQKEEREEKLARMNPRRTPSHSSRRHVSFMPSKTVADWQKMEKR